ncbi:unnamed protein product, partial [Brassica oleracea var. botrytis]
LAVKTYIHRNVSYLWNESYRENKLYKSPTNLATPARIPGGAYHGAADMMICIFSCMDTVGGVRLPSRYCGVLGFKSSHGTISNKGIMPVSYSLDS